MNGWRRPSAPATNDQALIGHLDIINRVKSNDPMLFELVIGDILSDKSTVLLLAEALRENTSIKRVILREYRYEVDHLQIISAALQHTKVSRISIDLLSRIFGQDLRRYAIAVGKTLNALPSLRTLDLNGCRLMPSEAIALSAILANNTTIVSLQLEDNEIGDEGAVAIGHMLKNNNRTLKEIVLDDNGITPHGQFALRNAIYDDSSFNAMAKSNHVLQSYFHKPCSVFGPGVMNDILSSHAANLRSTSDKQAVTKKLKRMLHKKYRVKLHFESFLGVETHMMPYVLGWMAQKCDLNMMHSFKPILLNLLEGMAKSPSGSHQGVGGLALV